MSIFSKDKEYQEEELFDLDQQELEQKQQHSEEEDLFVEAPEVKPQEEKITLDMDVVEPPAETRPYIDEMGIIAKDTTVHGSVRTKGHLAIAGTIEGDVYCAGNLMLTGNVQGQVECYNVVLGSNMSLPKLKVQENVSIKENIEFTGDISCNNISVSGKVNGNITAHGNIGVSKNAVIEGSITAKVLAIEPGAKIKGYVNTF